MFWKRKRKVATKACFWTTDPCCLAGFTADVKTHFEQRRHVLVIGHYSMTNERVSQQLASAGVYSTVLSAAEELAPHRLEWLCRGGSVAIIPHSLLVRAAPFAPAKPAPLVQAAILVPEMYPTSGREALVGEFAAGLPFEVTVTLYASLQSPLMRMFGSEKIVALMHRLGINENERLEHPFLADSLRAVQRRIEGQIQQETPAASQREWFELNLPEGSGP